MFIVVDTFLVSFLCPNTFFKKASERWHLRTFNSLVLRKIFQNLRRESNNNEGYEYALKLKFKLSKAKVMGVKGKNKLFESIISYLIDLKFLLLKWPCVG